MSGACLIVVLLGAPGPPQSDRALPPPIAPAATAPESSTDAPPPRHRRDWLFEVAMSGVSGGNATDLTFTLYALNRGRGEANPVLHPLGRHPLGLAAAKTGMTVSTMYALVKLHDRRPKLATAIATGAAAVMLSVAARNATLLRGPPR